MTFGRKRDLLEDLTRRSRSQTGRLRRVGLKPQISSLNARVGGFLLREDRFSQDDRHIRRNPLIVNDYVHGATISFAENTQAAQMVYTLSRFSAPGQRRTSELAALLGAYLAIPMRRGRQRPHSCVPADSCRRGLQPGKGPPIERASWHEWNARARRRFRWVAPTLRECPGDPPCLARLTREGLGWSTPRSEAAEKR